MRPTNNRVIIRPDAIKATLDLIDNKWTAPIMGTVIAVPDRLYCHIDKVEAIRQKYGQNVPEPFLNHFRMLAQTSVPTDTGLEVKPGDKVYFSWLVNYRCMVGENLVVPYDTLIARGDLYPLNGYVLIKMDEEEFFVDANTYESGEVVSVGKPCKFLESGTGHQDIQPGDKVTFDRKSVVRLEVDEFSELNPDGQSSLFRIKRKDIWTTIRS